MSLVLVLVCLLAGPVWLFAGTRHTLKQWVTNVPFRQEKWGYHYFVYNTQSATTNVLDELSEGSDFVWTGTGKLKWEMNLAYFLEQWSAGDTILCFGCWDSAFANDSTTYGDNFNHTGFYWLFSDTIDDKVNQKYEPYDTLRSLPQPVVSQTGPGNGSNDTIWVKIPNPEETRRVDQNVYDVLGFSLYADTTGTGTPNAYNGNKTVEIGFIPVQGDDDDTTVYWQLESEFFAPWNHWTTFFAYRLVVRPDTSSAENPDSPGYSTVYFSQNSDTVDVYQIVVGVDECDLKRTQTHAVFPNPFSEQTTLLFTLTEPTHVTIKAYNTLGQLVATICDEARESGTYSFSITDDALGLSGVYYYFLQTTDQIHSGRLVLLH